LRVFLNRWRGDPQRSSGHPQRWLEPLKRQPEVTKRRCATRVASRRVIRNCFRISGDRRHVSDNERHAASDADAVPRDVSPVARSAGFVPRKTESLFSGSESPEPKFESLV
jgi:hypothetical protein